MGANSKIEWTHHTFNPWLGCSKLSPACRSCYAEAWAKRSGLVQWGDQAERRRTSDSYWGQPRKWNRKAQEDGARRRVFCASLADVFEDRPELAEWRDDLFEVIHRTPHLDWLLLTKRPENILRLWPFGWVPPDPDDYTNLWIGTTVENQEMADKRIPELLKIPAAVRFLSVEPLLGPVDLDFWLSSYWDAEIMNPINGDSGSRCEVESPSDRGIHWVIVGGESGPNARTMQIAWVRDLRDQCVAANVPFFFKQWSGLRPGGARLLDGRTWDQFPEAA